MESLYGRKYAEVQHRRTPDVVMAKVAEMPILPGEKVLELGVGNTDVISHVQKNGGVYVGIDINRAIIERVRKEAPGVQLLSADALKLPFRDGAFDKVISIHTLEHLPHLSTAFAELYRVTRQEGENIHIVPADYFFKEESAIPDAVRIHPFNPIRAFRLARKLHLHKLNKNKVLKNMVSAPFMGERDTFFDTFFIRGFPIPRRNHSIRLYKF